MPILAVLPSTTDEFEAAVGVIEDIPRQLADARKRLKITESAQARQIGITTATLRRLAGDSPNPSQSTILACLRWLSARG